MNIRTSKDNTKSQLINKLLTIPLQTYSMEIEIGEIPPQKLMKSKEMLKLEKQIKEFLKTYENEPIKLTDKQKERILKLMDK